MATKARHKGGLYRVLLANADEAHTLVKQAEARAGRKAARVLAPLLTGKTPRKQLAREILRAGLAAAIEGGGLRRAQRLARRGLLEEMRAYEVQDPAEVPAITDLGAAVKVAEKEAAS